MKTSTKKYKDALAQFRKQVLSNRFLRWWLEELSRIAPAWMRPKELDVSSFFLVPLAQIPDLQSAQGDENRRNLAITVPPSRLLRKTLTLPLATEENLRQVLEFQVEQHTPFVAGQIYLGFRVTGRDFEQGLLTVDFVATPRRDVDVAIKGWNDAGSTVRAVFPSEMLATGNLVNLLPTDTVPKHPLWRHGPNLWLAVLVVVMALAAMALPLVIKREAVLQLLPWVEKGKKAAETVDAIRRELETRVDQHNYLLAKRNETPTVIQTLEELTRVLPDDTSVQTLDIKGNELLIQGETASSVKMIALFEQSSLFKDASFRAPLVKGQATGTERYQLALQVGIKAAPAVAADSAKASAVPAEKKP